MQASCMQAPTPGLRPARRSSGRAASPLATTGTPPQHTQSSRRQGPPPCLATGGDDKPPSGGGPPGKPPGGPSDESGTGDHDPDDDEVVHLDEVCRPSLSAHSLLLSFHSLITLHCDCIVSPPCLFMMCWARDERSIIYAEYSTKSSKPHRSSRPCKWKIQCTQELSVLWLLMPCGRSLRDHPDGLRHWTVPGRWLSRNEELWKSSDGRSNSSFESMTMLHLPLHKFGLSSRPRKWRPLKAWSSRKTS